MFWPSKNTGCGITVNATRTAIVFPQPVKLDRVVTMEDLRQGQHVHRDKIQALVGSSWKTVAAARTIGHKKIDRFAPVTASVARLRVIESSGAPQIRNFEVYSASVEK
jgi:alpha-L-fucosidase